MATAIRHVASGSPYYSEGLAEKLDSRRKQENFTSREIAVIALLVSGRSNQQIGTDLQLSISTVKHHLERIFVNLGVTDRTQAATAAVQRGIIRLDE